MRWFRQFRECLAYSIHAFDVVEVLSSVTGSTAVVLISNVGMGVVFGRNSRQPFVSIAIDQELTDCVVLQSEQLSFAATAPSMKHCPSM